jgi:hypothetical protein
MCADNDNLPGYLYSDSGSSSGADLPNQHDCRRLPDSSCHEFSICNLVGYRFCQRRLQRCIDQQQYRRTSGLRRFHDRYFHLYEYNSSNDHHLPGNIHGGCCANGGADLPDQYNGSCLPNTGRYKHGICHLAGHGQRQRRLQRGTDEQQHRCPIRMWWFHNGDLHLHQLVRTDYNYLSSHLHGLSFNTSCFELSCSNNR